MIRKGLRKIIQQQKLQKKVFKDLSLDPVKFLSAPGLAWQAALKKTEVEFELLVLICY